MAARCSARLAIRAGVALLGSGVLIGWASACLTGGEFAGVSTDGDASDASEVPDAIVSEAGQRTDILCSTDGNGRCHCAHRSYHDGGSDELCDASSAGTCCATPDWPRSGTCDCATFACDAYPSAGDNTFCYCSLFDAVQVGPNHDPPMTSCPPVGSHPCCAHPSVTDAGGGCTCTWDDCPPDRQRPRCSVDVLDASELCPTGTVMRTTCR